LVTHEELLQAVWPDVHVQPQTVKRHILDIRNALGDDPRNPVFIETLPRRGYQFIAPVSDAAGLKDSSAAAGVDDRRLPGREPTLAELREYLRRASGGQRQIVFVRGEPGIGKTALVDEFLRQATAHGRPIMVARGQCIEGYGGKEPYYPILQALGTLFGSSWGDYVIRILAEQAPTWLVQFPALVKRGQRESLGREIVGTTRERMLREVGEALETITADSALLLVLEDLQWVDPSTVDLISSVARGRTGAKLMVIGTYRPVDLVLSEHPLKAVKADLLVHHLCHEIALEPLRETAVTEFLAAGSSPPDLPKGLAGLLHQHTEGNPLFMVAALQLMTERKFITRENGRWRLLVPLEEIDLAVPENLRLMIEAQIERLDEKQQRLLEVASVAGALFSSIVSAEAANLDVETFQETCATVARSHHMIHAAVDEDLPDGRTSSRYEFTHALYRDVFYQRIAPGRRAKLHRRIGESLEAIFHDNLSEIAPELAHHFDNGSDWPRAIKYMRLNAETSARRFAQRETVEALQRALELLKISRDSVSAGSEIEVLGELGAVYAVSFQTLSHAVEVYDTLVSRASQEGLIDYELSALIDMIYPSSWICPQHAQETLHRALVLAEGQGEAFRRANGKAALLVQRMQAAPVASSDTESCRMALRDTRKSGNRLVLASLLANQAIRECDPLNCWAAVTFTSERGRCRFMYLLFGGDWNEALKELEAGIAAVSRNTTNDCGPTLRLCQAWVHLCAMDFAGVLAICKPMLESESTPLRGGAARRFCQVLAGSAEIALGHCDSALQLLLESKEEMDRQMLIWDWYWRMALQSALTEAWLKKGDLLKARAQADVFMNVTVAAQDPTWHALAWEVNTRVALAERNHKGAQDCNAKALAAIHGLDVPLAAWRVHATAAELYQATGNLRAAQRSQELSKAIIVKLANGLEEPLRQSFLSGTSASLRASSVRLG
jgi:hypothetical protein